jgi:YidC/Oxa1 family membrane protein insertase
MIDQPGPTGLPKEDYSKDDRNVLFGMISPKDEHKIDLGIKANAELQNAKDPFPAGYRYIGSSDDQGSVGQTARPATPMVWLAADNKFFASSMYLMPHDPNDLPWDGAGARFYYGAATEGGGGGKTFFTGMKIGVGWTNNGQEIPGLLLEPKSPEATTQPHRPTTLSFDIFSGPKKRDIFLYPDTPGSEPLYQRLAYVDLLSTQSGSCCSCSYLTPVTLGMMWLLQHLSIIAFGNYGVAIMLLVCMVRLALHPLTKRGQVSMSKMSKFGPALKELQTKYADDKETLQKETMRFCKEHGATPILGCLPMFLQMPIWIALWTGLSATVELRHAAFLPFWLTDMAAPDCLFTWNTPLPLIGIHSLNLLPLLLTVAMFFQTKLNPSGMGATPATTPDQQKQQKMMQYMMPVMMLFIFYNMPSGLNLYVMTSTFAGVIEQIVIRRHIARKQAEAESLEVVVQGPGKAGRDVRGKKPKGPMWHKQ